MKVKVSQKKNRFRLLISYRGSNYYGWQKQNNLPTIQGQIENALKQILQEDISIVGAGRTDTGAHALGQSAHFTLSKPIPNGLNLQKALNSHLISKDINIRKVWKTPTDFHALRSATSKYYAYLILNRSYPCIFRKGQIYWYPHLLNTNILQTLSQRIQGRHDFKSFQSSGTPIKNTIRTIYLAKWKRIKKDTIAFQIKGEGFLKQMIRNLIGTQLALLKEKEPLKKLDEIFSAKDRRAAYTTAPAEGLYLCKVSYPTELDSKCQKI